MRTTLNIDDATLAGAMKTARGKTKTAVINEALQEYARRRRILLARDRDMDTISKAAS